MASRVVFLPGSVLPAQAAYGALVDALGTEVDALVKDLEVYALPEPPPAYTLDDEVDGVLRTADQRGWKLFHLVAYSVGGPAPLAFAPHHPERRRLLARPQP